MADILILTGGPDHAHDFFATGAALATALDEHHEVTIVEHPDHAAELLACERPPDALVINALRWQMLGDKYDPWRERWGYQTPATTRAAIEGFVHGGGGLVGNHTATICFDDWPQWGDILGGAWNWQRSSHPPPQRTRVWITENHPVVDGLGDEFEITDEIYGDLDLCTDAEILAWAKRSPEDAPQPVVWTHTYGAGRIVYDGLGHDAASLGAPAHRRLIAQAVDWVLGSR